MRNATLLLASVALTMLLASGVAWATPVKGTEGPDTLQGTPSRDVIIPFDGDDTVYAESGGDQVRHSFGDDTIYGDSGGDTLRGGRGNGISTAVLDET